MGIRVSDDLETGLDDEPGIKEHQEQLSVHRNLLFVRSLEDLRLYTVIKEAHKAGLRVWVDIDRVDAEEEGAEPHDLKILLKRLDRLAYADGSEVDYTYVRGIAEEAARVIRHLARTR